MSAMNQFMSALQRSRNTDTLSFLSDNARTSCPRMQLMMPGDMIMHGLDNSCSSFSRWEDPSAPTTVGWNVPSQKRQSQKKRPERKKSVLTGAEWMIQLDDAPVTTPQPAPPTKPMRRRSVDTFSPTFCPHTPSKNLKCPIRKQSPRSPPFFQHVEDEDEGASVQALSSAD